MTSICANRAIASDATNVLPALAAASYAPTAPKTTDFLELSATYLLR